MIGQASGGLLTLGLFGNLGWQELLIILVIVVLIFGPKNLPKLGRIFGKSMREFRSASSKMSEAMQEEDDDDEDDKPRRRETLDGESRTEKTRSRSSEEKAPR